MILDEKESYQLHIKKGKLLFNVLLISYFYYRLPLILYRKWQLNATSGWVILYALISIIAIFSTIRLIKMLFSNSFVFDMSDRGITTKAFGFMDWKDIKDIKVNKSGLNNTTLLIFLHHPESFKLDVELSDFRRKVMKEFDIKEGTPFFIDISQTDYKAVTFDAALAQYKK
jgi:hypothetical protein